MTAIQTKLLLSGSTSGRPINVDATATPGTLIHTAVAGAVDFDEIWLFATNTDSAPRKLTIEFGGVTAPDDLIEITIEAESGSVMVIPGIPLNGGLVVRAFASAADAINISGFANRITS